MYLFCFKLFPRLHCYIILSSIPCAVCRSSFNIHFRYGSVFLTSFLFLFLILHVNDITQYSSFYVWLHSVWQSLGHSCCKLHHFILFSSWIISGFNTFNVCVMTDILDVPREVSVLFFSVHAFNTTSSNFCTSVDVDISNFCGFGEDFWESLGLQGDPTTPS